MRDKKIIILILLIILILVVVLNFILFTKKYTINEINQNQISNEVEQENIIGDKEIDFENDIKPYINTEKDSKFKKCELSTLYFDGISCINSYVKCLSSLYLEEEGKLNFASDIDLAEKAYSILDNSYKSKNNITVDNISNIEKTNSEFVPTSALLSNQDNKILFISGYLANKDDNTTKDASYLVILDEEDGIFSLKPYDKKISEGDQLKFSSTLEKNDYNEYYSTNWSDSEIANKILDLFKTDTIYKPDIAFNMLNKEYANKFGNSNGYSNYINNNIDKLNDITVKSCTKVVDGDHSIYSCKDNNLNNFIIKINSKNIFEIEINFSNIML